MALEPSITINGKHLTIAQAMAVRVAATWFMHEMAQSNALGDDKTGKMIAEGYATALSEVTRLMRE